MDIDGIIAAICHEPATPGAIGLMGGISTTDDLVRLLDAYNWDDGFAVPTAIALHPCADLAVALRLYWLGNADYWHENDEVPSPYNTPARTFGRLVSERILSGCHPPGTASFDPGFNRVDLHHFRQRNLPEVLYTPVVGTPKS